MNNKKSNAEHIYINEIIRINYKCNWKCKFCNVLKTNNYWKNDITNKEIIYNLLKLIKKYSFKERKKLILSFSWWEPTLNKNLFNYIKLAKKIWIWVVEIQTNWTKLFKDKKYINKLINVWLDEIFLAQHSSSIEINNTLWVYYNIDDFKNWVKYIKDNKIDKKISIYLNIVVTKINIFQLYNYIKLLLRIWFINVIPLRIHSDESITHKISFWYCQPNWYAEINKDQVLLDFSSKQIKEIEKIVDLCRRNKILPDFHFTSPPLCVLNYPEYNLEYSRLRKLEENKKIWNVNKWNLESYKWLWKEKQKFDQCKKCDNNKYCLWFYKNWIEFVWEKYIKEKISNYLIK